MIYSISFTKCACGSWRVYGTTSIQQNCDNLIQKGVFVDNIFVKWICMLACLITSIVAINVGLFPFGYDFFKSDFVMVNMARFVTPMYYVVLGSGIVSLLCFLMCSMGNCCKHHGKCCGD